MNYSQTRFTDTSLLQTVSFVSWESPYIFSKSNPLNADTPINAENGDLYLAQSTDFHRKATSILSIIRALHCQLCTVIDLSFLKVKNISLDIMSSTPDKMNCSRQFRLFQHQKSYSERRIVEWCFSVSVDLIRGMTASWRLEKFSWFIDVLVFFSIFLY